MGKIKKKSSKLKISNELNLKQDDSRSEFSSTNEQENKCTLKSELYSETDTMVKHLIKLQNVSSEILKWDDIDDIDISSTEKLFSEMKLNKINESLNSSAFADYLLHQDYNYQDSSIPGLCGAFINTSDNTQDVDERLNDIMETISKKDLEEETKLSEVKSEEERTSVAVVNDKSVDVENSMDLSTFTNIVRPRRSTIKKDYKRMALGNVDEEETNRKLVKMKSNQQDVKQKENKKNDGLKRKKDSKVVDIDHEQTKENIEVSSPNDTDSMKSKEENKDGIDLELNMKENDAENINLQSNLEVSMEVDSDANLKGGLVCIYCQKNKANPNSFSENLCHKCMKVLKNIKHSISDVLDLVCIANPPCWRENSGFCYACTVQDYITKGLILTQKLETWLSTDVATLRNSENVEKAKKKEMAYCEKYLELYSSSKRSGKKCCVLPENEEQRSVHWPVNLFRNVAWNTEEDSNEAAVYLCFLCNSSSVDMKVFEILQNHKYICQNCMLKAHRIARNLTDIWKKCPDECSDVVNCDICFGHKLVFICEYSAFYYRIRAPNNKACRICYRKTNLRAVTKEVKVCFICIWRLKLHYLKGSEKCEHQNSYSRLSVECDGCLFLMAKMTIFNVSKVITVTIPYQCFKLPKGDLKEFSESEESTTKSGDGGNGTMSNETMEVVHSEETETKPEKVKKSTKINKRPLVKSNIDLVDDNIHIKQRKLDEDDKDRKLSGKRKISKPKALEDYFIDEKINEKQVAAESVENEANDFEMGLPEQENEIRRSVSKPRIKNPCNSSSSNHSSSKVIVLDKADSQIESRYVGGPRVKNVSRKNVNEVNLETPRSAKCIVKKGSRSQAGSKASSMVNGELPISGGASQNDNEPINTTATSYSLPSTPNYDDGDEKLSQPDEIEETGSLDMSVHSGEYQGCGYCDACTRSRKCGKCDQCKNRKLTGDKTLMCATWKCVAPIKTGKLRSKRPKRMEDLDVGAVQCEGPKYNGKTLIGGTVPLSEVWQKEKDSDVEEESDVHRDSEEELDSLSDRIKVNTKEIMNGRIGESGFPVVTTVRGAPSKVICFSCGSGGDHMIHCVSCAEPYHFFCIELAFRPKSKEMFVCRNCTQCKKCTGFTSDLKCVKCQSGYHIKCLGQSYPPALAAEEVGSGKWACHECAMCLHCGIAARECVSAAGGGGNYGVSGGSGGGGTPLDWSSQPWQCGRCERACNRGEVCATCQRALVEYSTSGAAMGEEYVRCSQCHQLLHRQCVPLTEEEFEVWQRDMEETDVDIFCAGCDNENGTGNDKVRKITKERLMAKMNHVIHKGGEEEQKLLETTNTIKNGALSQMDGFEDDLIDQYDGVVEDGSDENMSNSDDNQQVLNSNIDNSTESFNDIDLDDGRTLLNPLNEDPEPTTETVPSKNGYIDNNNKTTDKVSDNPEMFNQVSLFDSNPYSPAISAIFRGLLASNFLTARHLLTEVVARINLKINRLSTKVNDASQLYNILMDKLQVIWESEFPWIPFQLCYLDAKNYAKSQPSKSKIIETIRQKISFTLEKERRVFGWTIADFEQKLDDSFQKGRDDFLHYHTDLQISALERAVRASCKGRKYQENRVAMSRYEVAFPLVQKQADLDKIEDLRNCVLCGQGGDELIEGRLLYCGLDGWIHVNCAIWSDEVYETAEGVLQRVGEAVARGLQNECSACGRKGATLSCCAKDSLQETGDVCSNIYHFGCAFNLLREPVFTAYSKFYCTELHSTVPTFNGDAERLLMRDMLTLRRVLINPGCLPNSLSDILRLSSSRLPAEEIVVTIGGLRVYQLGYIEPGVSDFSRNYLVPINYSARRLFWSFNVPDKLVIYSMQVRMDQKSSASLSSTSSSISLKRRKTQADIRSVSPPVLSKKMSVGSFPSKRMCASQTVYEIDDNGNMRLTRPSQQDSLYYDSDERSSCSNFYDFKSVTSRSTNNNNNNNNNNNRRTSFRPPKNMSGIYRNSKNFSSIRKNQNVSSRLAATSLPSVLFSHQKNLTEKHSSFVHTSSHSTNLVNMINKACSSNAYNQTVSKPPQATFQQQQQQLKEKPGEQLQYKPCGGASTGIAKINTTLVAQPPPPPPPQQQQQQQQLASSVSMQYPKLTPVLKINRHGPLSSTRAASFVTKSNNVSFPQNTVRTKSVLSNQSYTMNWQGNVGPQKVLKITRIGNSKTNLSNVNHHNSSQQATQSSVLRNVLTEGLTMFPVNKSSDKNNPTIVSCGIIPTSSYQQQQQQQQQHHLPLSLAQQQQLPQPQPQPILSVNRSTLSSSIVVNNNSSISNNVVSQLDGSYDMSDDESVISSTKRPAAVSNKATAILRFTVAGASCCQHPKNAWVQVTKKVGVMRDRRCDYPLRTMDGWTKFGLDNKMIIFLLEQMQNAFRCENYEFKFHKDRVKRLRENFSPLIECETGASRFESWLKRRPDHIARDPLSFLNSQANKPPPKYRKTPHQYNFKGEPIDDEDCINDEDEENEEPELNEYYVNRLADQFRVLESGAKARMANVRVCTSTIHGRGLFALRDFEPHEIIIEYVGELIRSSLSDVRESRYQKSGIDCYMFRLDQNVIIDATISGNAARFINHSCSPNCYAKIVKLHGRKHIIIIASRKIRKGEEFTYDYQFPVEDQKLACTCGSFGCKKYLN